LKTFSNYPVICHPWSDGVNVDEQFTRAFFAAEGMEIPADILFAPEKLVEALNGRRVLCTRVQEDDDADEPEPLDADASASAATAKVLEQRESDAKQMATDASRLPGDGTNLPPTSVHPDDSTGTVRGDAAVIAQLEAELAAAKQKLLADGKQAVQPSSSPEYSPSESESEGPRIQLTQVESLFSDARRLRRKWYVLPNGGVSGIYFGAWNAPDNIGRLAEGVPASNGKPTSKVCDSLEDALEWATHYEVAPIFRGPVANIVPRSDQYAIGQTLVADAPAPAPVALPALPPGPVSEVQLAAAFGFSTALAAGTPAAPPAAPAAPPTFYEDGEVLTSPQADR
jgi:hypothetical protein